MYRVACQESIMQSMRTVMLEIESGILDGRRRTGADRWDEMWDGVLHMPPMPNRSHQELELKLGAWLDAFWAVPNGNRVYPPINLALPGRWPQDYRIPDLVLLTPDRFQIDCNEYFDSARPRSWKFAARATNPMRNCPSTRSCKFRRSGSSTEILGSPKSFGWWTRTISRFRPIARDGSLAASRQSA